MGDLNEKKAKDGTPAFLMNPNFLICAMSGAVNKLRVRKKAVIRYDQRRPRLVVPD